MTTPPQQPGQDDAEDQSANPSAAEPDETNQNAAAETESSTSEENTSNESGEQGETDASDADATQAISASQVSESAEQSEQQDQQPAEESGTEKFTPAADATSQSSTAEQTQQQPAQQETQDSAEQEQSQQPAQRKKRRTGWLIGAVAAAVVIIGGGIGAYFVFFAGASAEATAQRYVDLSAQETKDPQSVSADDYSAVVCSKAMPQIKQLQQQKQLFLQQAKPQDLEQIKKVKTELDNVQENGDSGTATVKTTVPGQQPQSAQLNLIKENGDWKLCG